MERKIYKVENLMGNTYQVLQRMYTGSNWSASTRPITPNLESVDEQWDVVFQGTISECEAWINLHEKGYM